MLTKEVQVANINNGKVVNAIAFFDTGSTRTFATESLIKRLELPTIHRETLVIEGIGGKLKDYNSKVVEMKIKTSDGFKLLIANSINKIAKEVPVINILGKNNPEVFYSKPDILIGMDQYFNFIESHEKLEAGLIKINSKVGAMYGFQNGLPTKDQKVIAGLAVQFECEYENDLGGGEDIPKVIEKVDKHHSLNILKVDRSQASWKRSKTVKSTTSSKIKIVSNESDFAYSLKAVPKDYGGRGSVATVVDELE